jgi:hypothetical protein
MKTFFKKAAVGPGTQAIPGAGEGQREAGGRDSPLPGWLVIATLTAFVTALSTIQTLRGYHDLQSGWSWDLAYYNQWYWALTEGDGRITVRPLSAFGAEGPSIWTMNYLAPIRLAFVPLYKLYPDPRTLLVIQNVLFWWIVPAAYLLVRSESRSEALAVSAALLVPLTPLLWPLVRNDFRELQLAMPFVLWAVHGIRSRSPGLAALGGAGMLACRQEYAVMLATFAFLPPREPEDVSVSLRWRHLTLLIGLLWLFFGFFGYLKFVQGKAADRFIDQFMGPKAPLWNTMWTALETLLLGTGAWAILACLAPRIAILALPWILGPCGGQWAMQMLGSREWHHVRYLMPMVSLVLAAGLYGYARLGHWLRPRPGGWAWTLLLWTGAAVICCVGLRDVAARRASVPAPIERLEAEQIWTWIGRVGPDEGVIADYQVSAPLSSRRSLYSYGMYWNQPKGFPRLGREFHWLFVKTDYPFLKVLLDQGFEVVHRGHFLTVARRASPPSP